jgi:hypothetical protein
MTGAKIAAGSAAALAALALAACGGDGGESDEEQVAATVESFVQAGNEGDSEAVCELLAADQAERIGRLANGDCAKALGDLLGAAERRQTEVRIDDVRIDGSRASADVTVIQEGDRSQEALLLVEEDGEWKLASGGL